MILFFTIKSKNLSNQIWKKKTFVLGQKSWWINWVHAKWDEGHSEDTSKETRNMPPEFNIVSNEMFFLNVPPFKYGHFGYACEFSGAYTVYHCCKVSCFPKPPLGFRIHHLFKLVVFDTGQNKIQLSTVMNEKELRIFAVLFCSSNQPETPHFGIPTAAICFVHHVLGTSVKTTFLNLGSSKNEHVYEIVDIELEDIILWDANQRGPSKSQTNFEKLPNQNQHFGGDQVWEEFVFFPDDFP